MDLQGIKQFVDDYISQSNRGTAWPYSYVVQRRENRVVCSGCGEFKLYSASGWDIFEKTRKQMLDIIHEDEPKFEGEPDDHEMVDSHDYVEGWEDVEWFFTEKEASRYLLRDGHNLGITQLYVKPFRRNEEAKLILRTMFELAGKDYDEESVK